MIRVYCGIFEHMAETDTRRYLKKTRKGTMHELKRTLIYLCACNMHVHMYGYMYVEVPKTILSFLFFYEILRIMKQNAD